MLNRNIKIIILFFLFVAIDLFGFDYPIIRGPYLQQGTPESMIIRWRTEIATSSQINYGLHSDSLLLSVSEAELTTEHEILLNDLIPDTKYYYSVGSVGTISSSGLDYFFETSPLVGSNDKLSIWIIGDPGTANQNQANVRDAYYSYADSTPTDLWLMLGDNAYVDGTDSEFQNALFEMYPILLQNSVVWPTIGNHETHTANSATQTGPYYDIFSLPKNGEAGGVPSGTEAYYSYNYANIHFICLNSCDFSSSDYDIMLDWLNQDLLVNDQIWTIAYCHMPPYSKGSHDSDTEGQLIDVRELIVPILEDAGVDLLLGGHSHSYERSFLMNGHYGSSNSITDAMYLDDGDGRKDGDGPYRKPSLKNGAHEGTVYAVVGSSGKVTVDGTLDHPAIFTSFFELGSLVLSVEFNKLDAVFLDDGGNQLDYFSIIKGDNRESNDPPIVNEIPGQTIMEGTSFDALMLDHFVIDLDHTDDQMNWVANGQSNLSIVIDDNRVATISVNDSNWAGQETILFTATDPEGLSGSDSVLFIVENINDPPVVDDIADQTRDEGVIFESITLDTFVTDLDNSDEEITWKVSGQLNLNVVIDEQRVATITAIDSNWFGTESLLFTATDPEGLSDSDSITCTVNPVNDQPQISPIPDQTIVEDSLFKPIMLDDFVNDPDNDDDQINWVANGQLNLTVLIDENRVATITVIDTNWFGNETILFTASDSAGLSDSDSVLFIVENMNDPPVVDDIADQTRDEGVIFESITLDTFVTDLDNSDEEITWKVSGQLNLNVVIDEQRVATITAIDSNWFGTESLLFTATDPEGLSDSDSITCTVNPVNDQPQISPIPDQTIVEDSLFKPIMLDDFVNDPDNDDDQINWVANGQLNLTVLIDENRVATITVIDTNWFGNETILFTASDSAGLSDSDSVLFIVENINDPPIIITLDRLLCKEDFKLNLNFTYLYDFVTDEDNPDSTLFFSLNSSEYLSVLAVSDSFIITPKDNWYGLDTLKIRVSDGHLSDSTDLFIQVTPLNDPPEIVNLPDEIQLDPDSSKILVLKDHVTDIDSNSDSLRWNFVVTNDSLIVVHDPKTGLLTLSAPNYSGETELICIVRDDSLASDTDTILVHSRVITKIEDYTMGKPKDYALMQNYPNPFNPTTAITYSLPEQSHIQIEIYNLLGQRSDVLVDAEKNAGNYITSWDGSNLPSGIYFICLRAEGLDSKKNFVQVKKAVLLK